MNGETRVKAAKRRTPAPVSAERAKAPPVNGPPPVSRDQQSFANSVTALCGYLERLSHDRAALADNFTPQPAEESALARLVATFGLTPFETATLLFAAAVELQPGVGRLCATLGDAQRPWPSFGLAIRCFAQPHFSATLPDAPLRGRRLLALGSGEVVTERALRIEERVLDALLGYDGLDSGLARRLAPVPVPAVVTPSQRELVPLLGERFRSCSDGHLQLVTPVVERALDLAAAGARAAGLAPYRLDAVMIPSEAAERDELARLWNREADLAPVALMIVLGSAPGPGSDWLCSDFVRRLRGPRAVVGAEPPFERGATRIDVGAPTFDDRVELWRAELGTRAKGVAIERLAAHFKLGPEAIHEASRQSEPIAANAQLEPSLWSTCRAFARPRMAELAQRVEPRAALEQVILPDTQRTMLSALVSQVRARARVHHGWGFDAQSGRGTGTAAVFAGPSGTGKTMAAEALANALGLDLYRIDLSAVVSKYIGETEENLRKVFDAAEAGGTVLLFDEADALFGKRTEVKDSHDRHANIEVSYLLQRMEAYAGLAILTTNMRKAIDDAFLRRVQFIIDFPFPDVPQRERIWAGIFPPAAPLGALDLGKLAKLAVAGGNISSIARNAAYLAADSVDPDPRIEMTHLLAAARIEYAKLGRSLPPAEIRGWVSGEEAA